MISDADQILEYPMVDKDPVERWTFGRVTLAGDAAHPMYPRGSNGAAQAAIDARTLADLLAQERRSARRAQGLRGGAARAATAKVVRTNREHPPDFINIKVEELVGDKPFDDLDNFITPGRIARAVGELQAHRRLCAGRRGARRRLDRPTSLNSVPSWLPGRLGALIARYSAPPQDLALWRVHNTVRGYDWMGVSDGDRPAVDDSDEALMARIARGDERGLRVLAAPPSAGHARARPPHSRQRRRRRGRGAGSHAAGLDPCAALAAAGGVPHLAHARCGQSLSRPQARARPGSALEAAGEIVDPAPGAAERSGERASATGGSPPPSPNCRRASARPSCSPTATA